MVEPGCPTAGNLALLACDGKQEEAVANREDPALWWHTTEEGCKAFWAPEDLDVTQFPGLGERGSKYAYVANRISTTTYDDFRKFVPIHGATMKKIIGCKGWHATREYFESLWEIDPYYIKGKRSKGYRWIESLRGKKCNVAVLYCPNFIKRLGILLRRRESDYGPMEKELLRVLDTLETTISDPSFVDQLKDKPGTKDEHHRRTVIEANIHALRNKEFGAITRDRQGRVHYRLTRTNREVRATLVIGGHETVEVDLANSQPFFLAVIFPDIPNLRNSVASGNFYADINSRLDRPYDLDEKIYQYPEFKRQVLMMIYRCPKGNFEWWHDERSKTHSIMQAADRAFPGLNGAIEQYSTKNGPTALPRAMQRMESDAFIDRALPRLQALGIPVGPIHDGFLCRAMDAPRVSKILEDELINVAGLKPTLRTGKAIC